LKYYAVIDTNVLVSALLKWDSVPGNVLQFTITGVVTPVLNEDILREYREVLLRKKFHFPESVVDAILDNLAAQAVFINEEKLDVNLPDPKDVVFYEVVMEERKNQDAFLVTGNLKHFPVERFIVTPRQFLDILLGK
jgi:putative PIN family toxin of toxin-antitoxin system